MWNEAIYELVKENNILLKELHKRLLIKDHPRIDRRDKIRKKKEKDDRIRKGVSGYTSRGNYFF